MGVVILIFDIKCSDFLLNVESFCYNVRWFNDIWVEIENIFDINL